jgi:hypothetical protein
LTTVFNHAQKGRKEVEFGRHFFGLFGPLGEGKGQAMITDAQIRQLESTGKHRSGDGPYLEIHAWRSGGVTKSWTVFAWQNGRLGDWRSIP